MVRKDISKIIEIENMSQFDPWSSKQLTNELNKRNTIGITATSMDKNGNEEILGYIVYQLNKNFFQIERIAVHNNYRKKGIGKKLIQKLISKLTEDRRNFIDIIVRENNLYGQLFLRSQSFKALKILRNQFEDTGEDGYLMRLRYKNCMTQLV